MVPISQVATMLHYHPRLVHLGWPDLSLVFESFQDPDMLVHGCPGQVKTWPDIIDFIKVQLSENSKQTFSTKAWIFWGHCHRGDYHFWGGQRFWLKLSYLFRLADTLVSASALTGDQTTGAPLLLAEGPVGHLQHHLLGPGQPQAHFESPPGKNNVPYMHQSHPFQFEEDVVPILQSLGPRLTTLTLYRLPDVDVLLIGELCPRLVLLRCTLHHMGLILVELYGTKKIDFFNPGFRPSHLSYQSLTCPKKASQCYRWDTQFKAVNFDGWEMRIIMALKCINMISRN